MVLTFEEKQEILQSPNRLTTQDVARLYGVQPNTVQYWHKRGVNGHRMAFAMLGRKMFTLPKYVEAFMRVQDGSKRSA